MKTHITKKAPLRLGVIAIQEVLGNITNGITTALGYTPLNEIFTEFEIHYRYSLSYQDKDLQELIKRGFDLAMRVKCDEIWCTYNQRTGFIYSSDSPLMIAHELGHALGLEHPRGVFCVSHALVRTCGETPKEIRDNPCKFKLDLMGCCASMLEETSGFSEKDIAFLRRTYL